MKLLTREIKIGGYGNEMIAIDADLNVGEGCDSDLSVWPNDEYTPVDTVVLTPAEQIEVCDIMIGRWQDLKATCEKGPAEAVEGEE